MTFPEFIEKKTPEALCATLGIPSLGTIYSWKSRGWIPRDVWPDLLLAYPEIGMRDLLAMETESKREA